MQVVKLSCKDVDAYLAFRAQGLIEEQMFFRVSKADDDNLGREFWQKRLGIDRVFGVYYEDRLVGIGGLMRLVGKKPCHKGLIWGMYIAPDVRNGSASNLLMGALLDAARGYVTHLQLTLMADNIRAQKYYERFGFKHYGIEPQSVMTPDGPADEVLMWRLVDGPTP